MSNVRIGFDLDGVFINKPPFIPKFIIEKLYKRRGNGIRYRYPGRFEQKIRILSHLPIFRPPMKKNLISVKNAHLDNSYLISSRFSFLSERTKAWDRVNDLFRYFVKTYFNKDDEQPHKFKDRIIKKEKIKKYIDDDLDLLLFLSHGNPDVELYWLNDSSHDNLPYNIKQIKSLAEFFDKYV